MDCVTQLTTLTHGLKRKKLQDHLVKRRKVRDECQVDLDLVTQDLEVTELKLAATPEVKAEALAEVQAQEENIMSRIALRLNDVIFKRLAVGQEIWVRAKKALKFSKAVVTALTYDIDMRGQLQYRLLTKEVCQDRVFCAFPYNWRFHTTVCLPVTFPDMDEAATKAFYHLVAAATNETICFI